MKVSAFYLEKQKSFIPKKIYFLSRTAKIDPKDGVSRPNFQWSFWMQVPEILRLSVVIPQYAIPSSNGVKLQSQLLVPNQVHKVLHKALSDLS
jgi:hypothetical protein